MSRGPKIDAVVNPPTPAQISTDINLDNYMYYAYNTSYTQTGLASAIGYEPLTLRNGDIVQSINNNDGFYGEAFVSVNASGMVTKNSNVVVAFEGTSLFNQSSEFTAAQISADGDIAAGKTAPAFQDAAAFAKSVSKTVKGLNIKGGVSVTGHSLGGAEAEYAAKSTGLQGIAFAGPGIKGAANPEPGFTDFIDEADPLGNYGLQATNSGVPLSAWGSFVTASPNINQFGTVAQLNNGSPNETNGVNALNLGAAIYHGSTSATGREAGLAYGLLSTLQSSALTIEGTTIQGYGDFHSLTNYAGDLGATLFYPDATCFVSGSRIRVLRDDTISDVRVDDLVIGERAVTASGAVRPIKWLGHRTIDCHKHPRPNKAMPIRIAAHAFGDNVPERDLRLSPGHPVLVGTDENGVGGYLVPIMCLINGTTIERVAVEEVTYWHVELDEHDILLAEGLPAESYIDLGSRPWFAGEDGVLYDPDLARPGQPDRCRPVAIDGPVVEAERRRLDMVFATRLACACAWPSAENTAFAI